MVVFDPNTNSQQDDSKSDNTQTKTYDTHHEKSKSS